MAGLVIGKVMADAVNEKLGVALKAGKLAVDCTDSVSEILTYGDEVHFPVFTRIGDAEDVVKGTSLVPEEIGMSDNVAHVRQSAKSIRVYDKDAKQIKGKVVDSMAVQLSEVMAKKIDISLVDEMTDNAVFKTPTQSGTSITLSEIEAGFEVFGDAVSDESFAGILINSRLRKDFLGFEEFTSISKTYAKDGNGVVDADNCIGYWHGIIPVYISDNGTFKDGEAITAIVKKGALGLIIQKETTIEEEREAKDLATDLVASNLYAVKLLDSKGVSILRKTVA